MVLLGVYKEAPSPRKDAKAFVPGGVMCACVLLAVVDLCAFDGKKAISYHHHQSVAFETRLLNLAYSQVCVCVRVRVCVKRVNWETA